jgi:hypothetical protein
VWLTCFKHSVDLAREPTRQWRTSQFADPAVLSEAGGHVLSMGALSLLSSRPGETI